MVRDGDDEVVDDEEEEDEEEEEEEEEEEDEDKDEEDDDDEDDGKEPRTIGQGEMVNNQSVALAEEGQETCVYTPWLQPPAPAPWAQTPEHHQ